MASPLSSFGKAPIWQVLASGVLAGALMGAGWYFLYYEEAAQQLENAKAANKTAQAELEKMQTKLENYEQEQLQVAKDEAEMQELIRKIPSSKSTVAHLMKPFQRQARLVGFEIASWAPGAEQRFDYYAKTPVEIHATGTWHQTAEFFRKVSEMEQVVNVEEVRLTLDKRPNEEKGVYLRVDFSAASFRFLSEAIAAPVAPPAPAAPAGTGDGAAPAGTGAAAPAGSGAEGEPAAAPSGEGAEGAPAQPAAQEKDG